jgi:hypothetical protein
VQRLLWGSRARRNTLWAAVAVLASAIVMARFFWLLYPHVNLTIFNESSAAISGTHRLFLRQSHGGADRARRRRSFGIPDLWRWHRFDVISRLGRSPEGGIAV